MNYKKIKNFIKKRRNGILEIIGGGVFVLFIIKILPSFVEMINILTKLLRTTIDAGNVSPEFTLIITAMVFYVFSVITGVLWTVLVKIIESLKKKGDKK